LRLRGLRPSLAALKKGDVWLAVLVFAVAIAPFILLPKQPGIYSYLPGIGAALLLAAIARSLYETSSGTRSGFAPIGLVPIIFVVALYVALTVRESRKWIQLAETNTTVLNHIATQQPKVTPNTFIVLSYAKNDYENRFPEGFGNWCFPWALRVLYMDRTVNGEIVREGESFTPDKLPGIHFTYSGGNVPSVVKIGAF
jgi:presenilin-like A22 family membrane protease